MIIDRKESFYIFIINSDYINNSYNPGAYIRYDGKRLTNKEYLEHWGKWIFTGDKNYITEMAEKLDPYTENETIPCIKYNRDIPKMMNRKDYVMCIYCDDREKDKTGQILMDLGVTEKRWSYERKVMEKWLPNGTLMEQWIKSHNLSEKEAEKVRDEAYQKFKRKFLNKPNDYCTAWEQ